MAGGPAFLRPEHELTTRLCYVDFDGDMALKESVQVGLNDPLPEDFVKQYCTQMYDGMKVGYPNIMVLNFWIDRLGQIVKTQIRIPLKEEQSDLGPHYLLFHFHHLTLLHNGKT